MAIMIFEIFEFVRNRGCRSTGRTHGVGDRTINYSRPFLERECANGANDRDVKHDNSIIS